MAEPDIFADLYEMWSELAQEGGRDYKRGELSAILLLAREEIARLRLQTTTDKAQAALKKLAKGRPVAKKGEYTLHAKYSSQAAQDIARQTLVELNIDW